MNTDEVQLDRYSAGQNVTFRAVHKPTGLVATAATQDMVLDELRAKVADAGTTVTVTTTYDQHCVPATVDPAKRMELGGGAVNVTRVIAIYRRSGDRPWEFGLVRLAGRDDDGLDEQAILVVDDDWPEWLRGFVADNRP